MIPNIRTDEGDQPRPPERHALVMTPREVGRLLPLVIGDLLENCRCPKLDPPNPVRRDEYLARERRMSELRLQRVNDLFKAWLEFEMERISG